MTYLDRFPVAPRPPSYLLWQIARSLPRAHHVAVRSVGDRDAMQATFLDGNQRTVDELIAQAPAGKASRGDTWLRDFDQETLRRAIAIPGDRWGIVRIPDKFTYKSDDEEEIPAPPILSEVSILSAGQCLILGVESLGGVVRALSEIWGKRGWEAAASSTSDEAFQRLTIRMVRQQSAAQTDVARAL